MPSSAPTVAVPAGANPTLRAAVVWRKALAVNSQPTPETFPELPTVLIWLRFGLALVHGLYLGFVAHGATGARMILHMLNVLAFIPVVYCRLYLGANADAFGAKILTAGLVPALALSLLIWIAGHTADQAGAEEKLTALLVLASSNLTSATATPFGADDSTGTANFGMTEEPEF